MTIDERISAAEDAFYARFEAGTDEHTEVFAAGVVFARGLGDDPNSAGMREMVVWWLERAARAGS
jgi:hypothetical protein